MKMKTFAIMLSAAALLFAAGCQKSPSGHEAGVPEAVVASFNEMYPGATDVNWSSKHSYWVADFDGSIASKAASSQSAGVNSAWYDSTGKWYMTELNGALDQLPEAVKAAFAASEYASWRVDDIDRIMREGMPIVYVIEVEGTKDGVQMEIDLYYAEDGVLVKEVVDEADGYDYWDYIPSRPASSVEDAVASLYPGAKIVDVEEDEGAVEVEIIDAERIFRELYFSRSLEWLMTKTEVRYNDLPAAVKNAFETSQYSSYMVDDIDSYIKAGGEEYYILELESRNGDVKLKITPDGTVSEAGYEDVELPYEGGGNISGNSMTSFIEGKYPGCRIEEAEEDDGYIKYDIFHDGKEKEVYFNGRGEWVWTQWDVRYQDLPAAVKQALSGYVIDDISYVETPSSVFYAVEVEGRGDDYTVRVSPEGNIL